jgi:hypothetical protein
MRLGAMVLAGTALAACSSSKSSAPTPPAATCSSGPVAATAPNSVSAAGEDVDTTCASVTGAFTWGAADAGASCVNPLDCAPVCCPCPNGNAHALATWCNAGKCAPPEMVCCMVLGTTLNACSG